jgi:hypothetical protein
MQSLPITTKVVSLNPAQTRFTWSARTPSTWKKQIISSSLKIDQSYFTIKRKYKQWLSIMPPNWTITFHLKSLNTILNHSTKVVSLNPAQTRFTWYNIMLSSLSVTCGWSLVSSTNKTHHTIYMKYCWKWC